MSQRLETGTQTVNPFSPRTILIGIIVSLMSFGAVLTLMAWAPELSDRERAGSTPYSRAATGYSGLITLLENYGVPVSISRLERSFDTHDRLLVLTPLPGDMPSAKARFEDGDIAEPVLIILPKWSAVTDRLNTRWQSELSLLSDTRIERVLEHLDDEAEIERITSPAAVNSPYGRFRPHFEDKMQVLQSDYLEPVIAAPTGQLLSKVPDWEIYILSDPDLANTFNLDTPDNAKLMVSILNELRETDNTPVIFDATLHGFSRSASMLRILLDVPFLGATLILLVAAGLLLWSAFTRFGAPAKTEQVFALGKAALADNTAGLISMTGREVKMAPDYLALSRKALLRELGITRNLSEAETNALLDRLSADEETGPRWSELRDDLNKPASGRDDLIQKARRLYRWRKERPNGH